MPKRLDNYKTYLALAAVAVLLVLQQVGLVGDAALSWEQFSVMLGELLAIAGVRHAIGPNRSR